MCILFFILPQPLMILLSFDRDMGCHIDGFIAVVAHTHVIKEGPVTGRAADVLAAANTAAEVAMRLVRPGKKVPFLFLIIFLFHNLSSFSCCVVVGSSL